MRPLLLLLAASLAAAPAAAATRVEKTAAKLSEELLARVPQKGASVAVMPFEDDSGRPVELGRALADAVTQDLVDSGKVTVQDRAYLSKMLGEIKLGMSGLGDPKAALQIGRFSGAKYLVVGRIEAVGDKATVEARLVVTETATLLATARRELKLDDELKALLAQPAVTDPGSKLFDSERPAFDAVFLDRPGVDGCRWIEAKADVPAGRDQDEGRAAAMALARRKAVMLLFGRDPGRAPDFEQAAFQGQLEGVLRATRPSVVTAENVTSEERSGGRERMTLETCLKPAKTAGDLRVELMLNQSRFIEGQDARALVTVNHDAHVMLFSADFSGRLWPVFPDSADADDLVRAGKPLDFPDAAQRAAGIRMTAALPPGQKTSVEMLRALAVEADPGHLLDGLKSWDAVVAALDGAGLPWADDVRVYTIYAK
ncbi:MAG: DUF4384 domain-containing protein [Elusimicrobia bacterium]|nr:DUF4384 domain-containing protein [Elusimicrobiota bacterium]